MDDDGVERTFNDDELPDPIFEREQHPIIEIAQDLFRELADLPESAPGKHNFQETAAKGMLDVIGGLVQGTEKIDGERLSRGLSIVQLKRALRGHSFVRGAMFGLSDQGVIDESTAKRFHKTLDALLTTIHEELSDAWEEPF